VSTVESDGPAAAAGLERGDVITALNGAPVKDSNELRNEIASLQPGTGVTLTVVRVGKERTLTAKLAELAGSGERARQKFSGESGQSGRD
jgi:serine protease Do